MVYFGISCSNVIGRFTSVGIKEANDLALISGAKGIVGSANGRGTKAICGVDGGVSRSPRFGTVTGSEGHGKAMRVGNRGGARSVCFSGNGGSDIA